MQVRPYGTMGYYYPDSKVHGSNMGLILGRQDPGWPNVGPMNFVIWVLIVYHQYHRSYPDIDWNRNST